jgi:MFS family permease
MSVGLFIFSGCAMLLGVVGAVSKGQEQIWGYYLFAILRVILGIGEASFVPLSVAIIDDISPPAYKSMYMAVLMVTCPLGIA